MFSTVKEAIAEKIEIIDLVEEQSKAKRMGMVMGIKPWMLVPVAVVALGTSAFFVIRRISKKSGK